MGGQSHTAERWRVDPNNNCDIQSEDGTQEIASTHPGLLKGGFCDPSTAQGYARLIAAAPDLFAGAGKMVAALAFAPDEVIEGAFGPAVLEALNDLREARAKATGESA